MATIHATIVKALDCPWVCKKGLGAIPGELDRCQQFNHRGKYLSEDRKWRLLRNPEESRYLCWGLSAGLINIYWGREHKFCPSKLM